jgi:riboflavin synthase
MFTGIIEEIGTIVEFKRGSEPEGGARIVIRAPKATQDGDAGKKLQLGESIAVNGCCLTALDITRETFAADLSPETIERTSLRALRSESRVNLERAMTASARFGGHIVQGHVDGVGTLVSLESLPDGNYWLTVEVPKEIEKYVVWKGSIALNGISLTVARLEENRVGVAVIPHTYENTVLRDMSPGDPINVECDVLAKYVERLLSTVEVPASMKRKSKKHSNLSINRLVEEGF